MSSTPPATLPHNPIPPDACGAQTHPHSQTDASSSSATKKISAPSKSSVNKPPYTVPVPRQSPSYKNQSARASTPAHPPPPNSILSPPSAAQYAPHPPK